MPQNLDAEMSVLGIAFLNKNSLTKICEELYADMFSTEDNQVLFNAIKHDWHFFSGRNQKQAGNEKE